jgi:hypothetical protein
LSQHIELLGWSGVGKTTMREADFAWSFYETIRKAIQPFHVY